MLFSKLCLTDNFVPSGVFAPLGKAGAIYVLRASIASSTFHAIARALREVDHHLPTFQRAGGSPPLIVWPNLAFFYLGGTTFQPCLSCLRMEDKTWNLVPRQGTSLWTGSDLVVNFRVYGRLRAEAVLKVHTGICPTYHR
jgi:hypothetical protein